MIVEIAKYVHPCACWQNRKRVHANHSAWRAAQAFTLIELAIVLLVTGIIAAIAVPRFSNNLQQFRVSNAASRIVADLARAQSAAYSSSTSITVTFTVASSQYSMSGVTPLDRSSGTYVVALNTEPYRSTLVSVWGQTGTQNITFNGYGLPNKGGNIIVAAGGIQKTVVVDATSGTALTP